MTLRYFCEHCRTSSTAPLPVLECPHCRAVCCPCCLDAPFDHHNPECPVRKAVAVARRGAEPDR